MFSLGKRRFSPHQNHNARKISYSKDLASAGHNLSTSFGNVLNIFPEVWHDRSACDREVVSSSVPRSVILLNMLHPGPFPLGGFVVKVIYGRTFFSPSWLLDLARSLAGMLALWVLSGLRVFALFAASSFVGQINNLSGE